jgi:hypothetical protein
MGHRRAISSPWCPFWDAKVFAAIYLYTYYCSKYLPFLADKVEDTMDVLSEEFEDNGRYREVKNAVATTWLISFEQIRRRDALAADYLSFMGCVDPRPIARGASDGDSQDQTRRGPSFYANYHEQSCFHMEGARSGYRGHTVDE